MSKSTRNPRSRKVTADRPPKPYPDFPLSPHASGSWCKKIRGTIRYFGKWGNVVDGKLRRVDGDGWQEALELYQAQRDDYYADRTPRVKRINGVLTEADPRLTVADLCNRFLTSKQRKLDAGEIGLRMFGEYNATTDRLVASFGAKRSVEDLAASDFESLRADLASRFGPVRLGNEITRVKSVFKYAADNGLLERATRFGSEFRKPGKAILRKHKATNGGNMMEAEEIRQLLKGASTQSRAMLLLMVNCGFGPTDCATLPLAAVDLAKGWINYPRPKTGIERRCPLWAETIASLREAIAARPKTSGKKSEGLLFVTARGNQWISGNAAHPVTVSIVSLMKSAGVHKKGRGPYTLRHVFRTIADGALDRVAIDLIMGHSDPSMGGHYRERVDDARLVAVAEHVRQWLFGATSNTAPRVTGSDSPANSGKKGNAMSDGASTPRDPNESGTSASTAGDGLGSNEMLRLYSPDGDAA